jgi:Secretion system C-terminal sorting domain
MKQVLRKAVFVLAGIGLGSTTVLAQTPEFNWANGLNGTAAAGLADSDGYSVTTDPAGNVYSCGFFTGTIDFDPGPGVFNMTAASPASWGIFVRKLDASGAFLWARMVGFTSQSEALAIAANELGVYTTGYFSGSADFNPGTPVATITSAGGQDLFMWSLNSNGDYNGTYRAGGTGVDRGSSIDIRGGNVYVAGVFSGSFDANPTISTSIITSNGGTDIGIFKLSSSGGFVWARAFGSTANDASSGSVARDNLDIAVDPLNGDSYIGGNSGGAMDVDPTAGVTNLPGAGAFMLRLTNAGAFVWGNLTTGATIKGVALDDVANVYSTGYFLGTIDFDPGAGTNSINSGVNANAFLRKMQNNGTFTWVIQVGGTGFDMGIAVVSGVSGNVYMTGRYEATADFDPSAAVANLTAGGSIDSYIAGYTDAGAFLWTKGIGGSGADYPYDIDVDYTEAIYTTGCFKNTVDFNTEAGTYFLPLAGYTSSIIQDAYLHKLSAVCSTTPSNPGFEWAGDMGNNGIARGTAIETDASGNVYTVGYFTGNIDFDPGAGVTTLVAADLKDAFVMKQDAAGNLVWVKQFTGKSDENALTVDVDATGNIVIAGSFTQDIDCDPNTANPFSPSLGAEDIFVVKMDGSGNVIWYKTIGGTGSDVCYDIAFNPAGEVVFTGYFTAAVDFDPGAGVNTLTSAGSTDIYLTKLDVNGNFVWATQQAGTSSEEGTSLSIDNSGAIYLCGRFGGSVNFNYLSGASPVLTATAGYDGFVGRFYTNGTCHWVKLLGGAGNDRAVGVAVDPNYNILYVTGLFSGTATLGGVSVTSVGSDDTYLIKLTTAGFTSWVRQFGQVSGAVYSQAVEVDSCSNVYMAGHYLASCDFDPNAGTTTLVPVGGAADVFIVKLKNTSEFCWAKSFGNTGSDNCYGIDVDAAASVYTTGFFQSTVDFNPGAGTYPLVCNLGSTDIFVQKLNIAYPVRLGNTVEEPTSQIADNGQLSIYPNPSEGLVTIDFGKDFTGRIEVLDISGKLIEQFEVNEVSRHQLEIRHDNPGVYLIRVMNETTNEVRRVIIQ